MKKDPSLSGLVTGIDQQPQTQLEKEQAYADDHNASVGTLDQVDGYNCDICKNRGTVAVVEQNEMFGYWYHILYPCKCQRVRDAIRRLNKARLLIRGKKASSKKQCAFVKMTSMIGFSSVGKAALVKVIFAQLLRCATSRKVPILCICNGWMI